MSLVKILGTCHDPMPSVRLPRILWRIRQKWKLRRWRRAVEGGNPPRLSIAETRGLVGNADVSSFNTRRKRFQLSELYRGNHSFPQGDSSVQALLKESEYILANAFRILRQNHHQFEGEIEWHSDFHERFKWDEKAFCKSVRALPKKPGADIKVPWELSRFQFLTTLAQASLAVGDEKYLSKGKELILDWIARNPVGVGVNWACTMDVAIRAVNWILFSAMLPDESADDAFAEAIQQALLEHGVFIVNNLEYGSIRGNHYVSDLAGLIFAGVFFGDSGLGQYWISQAVEEFEKEILLQVYPDGADFEDSVTYHRLVLELYVYTYIFCEKNSVSFSQEFRDRLKGLFQFLSDVEKPDGRAPLRGDNDSGRFIQFHPDRADDDFAYLRDLGSVLFDTMSFSGAEGFDSEAKWLLNDAQLQGLPSAESTVPSESASYGDAGVYLMRDNRDYAMISCGKNGIRGWGCHTHNDRLAAIIVLDGVELFTDPGQFTYTTSEEMRNYFRSTHSHNTLAVNGAEQIEFQPGQLFRLEDVAWGECLRWNVSSQDVQFEGRHNGYHRLVPGLYHHRAVSYHRGERRFDVEDWLVCEGDSQLETVVISFILSSEVSIKGIGDREVIILHGDQEFVLGIESQLPFELKQEAQWYSPAYGVKVETIALRIVWGNVQLVGGGQANNIAAFTINKR